MQLTYEGLIDEVLRISNGTVEMTTEAGDAGPARTTKTRLNSTDPIFRELRDLNFGRACDKLREKSIAIQQDYKVRALPRRGVGGVRSRGGRAKGKGQGESAVLRI